MVVVSTSSSSDDGDFVIRKSFRHYITGAIIVAPPGKAFRIPTNKGKGKGKGDSKK